MLSNICCFPKVESGSGAVNEVANTVMQKFWDSALNLEPPDDFDTLRYFCFLHGVAFMTLGI